MKRPDWLKPLTQREERARAHHGLTPKRDGWYKWVAGKSRYISKPAPVLDVVAALEDRIKVIEAQVGVRTIPVAAIGLTLEGLAELYITWLRQRLETGIPKKLARRTYDDIVQTLDRFVEIVGADRVAEIIGPDDFSRFSRERFKGRAASTIRREIIYIEAFANWAAPGSRKAGHLTRPWRYGPDFRKPPEDEITTSAADSDKAYTADQLRGAFLAIRHDPALRAIGWVALCAAMQPKDIGLLPQANIDLNTGLVTFPRGKTGVGRMAWLPPAAVLAVRNYLKVRPAKCDTAAIGLLFRTENGTPYYRQPTGEDPGYRYDWTGIRWHRMTGLPLSGLRSTFATHADDHLDQRAVDVVMGHKSGHMSRKVRSKHYAKRFNPDRVKLLTSRVVALAFGRVPRKPGGAEVVAVAPQESPASAVPSDPVATPPTPTPVPDTSPASRRGSVHPKLAVLQSK